MLKPRLVSALIAGGPLCSAVSGLAAGESPGPAPALEAVVEAEDVLYDWKYVDWGPAPLWCYGNTCIVRLGEEVFASGLLDPRPGQSRWTLHRREKDGWQLLQKDQATTTREPCPLGCFPDGRILLSHSPAQRGNRAEILDFSAADPRGAYKTILPWGDQKLDPTTYRTFAVDGASREMLLFHNSGTTHAEWAFCDRDGKWSAKGRLAWPKGEPPDTAPYGAVYARANYPTAMLKNRAVHLAGAAAWNVWSRVKQDQKLMGRRWGNRWRRLFYTWTPDVTKQGFSEWIEVGSTHETGGWLFPGDLWVDDAGTAHIVWSEAPVNEDLRDKHFPDLKRVWSLRYAQVKNGRIALQKTLVEGGEGRSPEIPGHPGRENFIKLADKDSADGYLLSDQAGRGQPRFHVLPGGRLFIFYYVGGKDAQGREVSENRLMEIGPDGSAGAAIRVPLEHPLVEYFTATPRGGSRPSEVLDVLGYRRSTLMSKVCYARIRIRPGQ